MVISTVAAPAAAAATSVIGSPAPMNRAAAAAERLVRAVTATMRYPASASSRPNAPPRRPAPMIATVVLTSAMVTVPSRAAW